MFVLIYAQIFIVSHESIFMIWLSEETVQFLCLKRIAPLLILEEREREREIQSNTYFIAFKDTIEYV